MAQTRSNRRLLGNQLLGGRHAVVDRETGGARVPAGRLDAFRRQVDAGDRGAEAGERLAQQAAAAADVERGQAGERLLGERIAPEPEADAIADVGKAHRIELVQRRERAGLVPPAVRERGEPLEFGRIAAACHACCAPTRAHVKLLAAARPTMYTPA